MGNDNPKESHQDNSKIKVFHFNYLLNDIDSKILSIKYNTPEKNVLSITNEMLIKLLLLQDIIISIMISNEPKTKTAQKEIKRTLSCIKDRIDDLYNIQSAWCNLLRHYHILEYKWINIESHSFITFLDTIFELLIPLCFIFTTIIFLQDKFISSYDIFIVIIILALFHTNKIKKISKDGIEFRKRKNW